jgi:superfamily II DNA or RNA helicase
MLGDAREIFMTDFIFKTEPYDHQREAFEASAGVSSYALLMDMGTGKTKVDLDTMASCFEDRLIDFCLIVAPKGVIANWIAEIAAHLPERVEREVVLWKPALTKEKRKELNDLYTETGKQVQGLYDRGRIDHHQEPPGQKNEGRLPRGP